MWLSSNVMINHVCQIMPHVPLFLSKQLKNVSVDQIHNDSHGSFGELLSSPSSCCRPETYWTAYTLGNFVEQLHTTTISMWPQCSQKASIVRIESSKVYSVAVIEEVKHDRDGGGRSSDHDGRWIEVRWWNDFCFGESYFCWTGSEPMASLDVRDRHTNQNSPWLCSAEVMEYRSGLKWSMSST